MIIWNNNSWLVDGKVSFKQEEKEEEKTKIRMVIYFYTTLYYDY